MTVKIPFSEISEHGVQLEITEPSWFPDHLRDAADSVTARIFLVKRSENKIDLRGNVKAGIRLECDRCLIEYRHDFDSDLQLIVELADQARHWRLQDLEVGKGELDTIQVAEPVVDLGEILRQQVLLNMPAKQLCGENCLGLCKYCGANLNERRCGCEEKAVDSPFAVLARVAAKRKN